MRQIPAGERLTAEDVIRDAGLFFSDMLLSRGLFQAAAAFHWHAEPELGFYCLYRAREGEEGILPDCPDISETARVHAEQLHEAGVDFIFADLTNLPEDNEFADALGLRPIEVLFEEWQALRDAGTPTPQIAIWVPATEAQGADAPLFRRVIELYQRPEYASLVLEHVPTGEPVVFIVDQGGLPASDTFLDEIRAAGLLPVRLWGNLPETTLAAGTAAWMQPCTRGGVFTTMLDWDTPCGQFWSPDTPIGSVVSVSASYQIGYASLPWQASGRLGGQTLRQQFATAFEVQPDYLLINAWNEHIAQPQANPFDESLGNLRQSMGIVNVPADDTSAPWLWVDAYGHDLSRDLEPTVEDGRKGYDLLRACIVAYRAGPGFCETPIGTVNDCCLRQGGMQVVRFAVLQEGAWYTSAHVPTLSGDELSSLVGGGAYTEACNFGYAPPGFCSTTTQPNGPFQIFREDGAERAPLHRCLKSAGNSTHLLSLNGDCEGASLEMRLGWVSTRQTSETPRILRRCLYTPTDRHFHVLDDDCPGASGVQDQGILGYVR